MSHIIVPRDRLVRPNGSLMIDPRNPFVRELFLVFVDNFVTNLISGKPPSAPNGSLPVVSGRAGSALQFNANGYYEFPITPKNPPVCTWLSIFDATTSTTNYTLGSIGQTSSIYERTQFDCYGGTPRSIFVDTGGGAYIATSAISLGNSQTSAAIFTINSSKIPTVYVKKSRTRTSGVPGSVGSYTVTRIGAIAKSGSGLDTYNNRIYATAVWDRVFSDAEAFALLENPWQIFKPIERRIYFGAAAAAVAGGPVIRSQLAQPVLIESRLVA